ncbi:hypothetical protein TNCV_2117351, partial [Trichonephila clavipes]
TACNRLQPPPQPPTTAYDRLQPPDRLRPPTTAYNRLQPPATACNRLHRLHRTAFTAESAFSTYSSSIKGHLSNSYPNHSRGPRCLSYNLYGHKSFECRRANLNNTSTPPSGCKCCLHELPSPINMFKDVTILGVNLTG